MPILLAYGVENQSNDMVTITHLHAYVSGNINRVTLIMAHLGWIFSLMVLIGKA